MTDAAGAFVQPGQRLMKVCGISLAVSISSYPYLVLSELKLFPLNMAQKLFQGFLFDTRYTLQVHSVLL